MFEAGLISEQERDTRNSSLRNYAWILETVSAGLATPSNSLAGSLVAAASPTIAKEIGQQFKQTGKEGSASHYLAHAGLGALVAAATGNNIAGNALAAAGAEAAAPIAASWIYGKDVSQLTPDEKATVSSIAGLAGAGLAGAAGGDGRSLVSGSVAGRTSVENNYLTAKQLDNFAQRARNCSGASCKKVIQDMVDTNVQQQEEIKAVCSASPEQCQQKYGYLIEQWDAFDTSIKNLAADKTLPGEFRDYLPAIYMMDTEAQGIAVEYGWSKRFEAMGFDAETAHVIAATLPVLVNGGGGKGKGTSGKQTSVSKVEAQKSALNKIGEKSKNTKDLSQKEGNTVYNRQLALLDKQAAKSKVVIDPNKVKYLFGKVNSNKHNSDRSTQMEQSMRRLGIPANEKGAKYLIDHLSNVPKTQGSIVKVYSDKYGKYEVRESLLFGPSGKATKLETAFQIMPDGTRRFVTTIPKEGKK